MRRRGVSGVLAVFLAQPLGTIATRSARVLRYSVSTRPRPRDCVTASRHDSAPGQLGDVAERARVGEPEARRREPLVERLAAIAVFTHRNSTF